MGNPFSRTKMLENFPGDEVENISNPNLLIQNNKRMKIHLDGFQSHAVEVLKLMEIIENNGGELVSDPGKNIISLSRPENLTSTGGPRFHVDWLYKSVSLKAVQDLVRYRLKSNSLLRIEADREAQKENDILVKRFERKDQVQRIAPVSTESIIAKRSTDIPKIESNVHAIYKKSAIDSSSDDEELPLKKREREFTLKSSPKHNCSCGSSKIKKRRRHGRSYTFNEEKEMINFLVDNDAISRAGGCIIWEKMVKRKKWDRSPTALQRYFNSILRFRIHLHTDDKRILAAFKQREKRLKLRYIQSLD